MTIYNTTQNFKYTEDQRLVCFTLANKIMKTQTIIAILTLSSCAFTLAREIKLDKPSSKLRRFASDAIFEVEAGDREKYSKRLPEHVIMDWHCTPKQQQLAQKILDELFRCTGVSINKPTDPSDQTAKISIYFGQQDELTKVAKEIDRKINLNRGYTYWTWWDEKRTINRAIVLIATDRVAGDNLEDRMIEQLLGVFGLPAKSNEINESCFSSDEPVFTSLQPVDKALLEFYYRVIPSGTKPREFDKLFKAHWIKK